MHCISLLGLVANFECAEVHYGGLCANLRMQAFLVGVVYLCIYFAELWLVPLASWSSLKTFMNMFTLTKGPRCDFLYRHGSLSQPFFQCR